MVATKSHHSHYRTNKIKYNNNFTVTILIHSSKINAFLVCLVTFAFCFSRHPSDDIVDLR